MKLSEQWLREFVNPDISRSGLIHILNMAGMAVESCLPAEDDPEDFIIEFELTPNRGDCLSALGIAREISVLTQTPLAKKFMRSFLPAYNKHKLLKSNIIINIQRPQDCPHYAGIMMRGLSADQITPAGIAGKLQKSGMKLIHPVVDALNYIMLELGQPLHAFDADKLYGNNIYIRKAKNGEKVILLDQKIITLTDDVLVIADEKEILAAAGIMGGLNSAVDKSTRAVFIESAFFFPHSIAGRARKYGLQTDASLRFERGVDYTLPRKALERAVEILQDMYPDLEISPAVEKIYPEHFPKPKPIVLRYARLENMLGLTLSEQTVKKILTDLNMSFSDYNYDSETESVLKSSKILPPSYRFDIAQEIDVIEETARIYGYERIGLRPALKKSFSEFAVSDAEFLNISQIKNLFASQGYQEIVTYSFISEKSQRQFDPSRKALKLSNPLSAELAVMRTSLWPGLMQAVQYNLNRRQTDLRFFEEGLIFIDQQQQAALSGVWAGNAFEEQWSERKRTVDFFDLKHHLSQLLCLTGKTASWERDSHPALHPGQTAKILIADQYIGICGALHPELRQNLDIKIPVFLFEIDLQAFQRLVRKKKSYCRPFSKFPAVRRDIALQVNKNASVDDLKNVILSVFDKNNKPYLTEIRIFDVYLHKNSDKKSIALGLVFQAIDRTLLDQEVQDLTHQIISVLAAKTGAVLRE